MPLPVRVTDGSESPLKKGIMITPLLIISYVKNRELLELLN